MNRIYFEALLVTIKMENRIRLHIFSFCCLNFLFFSLRGSEIYLRWVSCFYFFKITVFITGNAPLILKIFNSKTDIYFFFIHNLLFFSYVLLFTISLLSVLNYICLLKYLLWSISFIAMSIMNGNYNFISNNVKVIKASEKRLKLLEYLTNNINDNGFTFYKKHICCQMMS